MGFCSNLESTCVKSDTWLLLIEECSRLSCHHLDEAHCCIMYCSGYKERYIMWWHLHLARDVYHYGHRNIVSYLHCEHPWSSDDQNKCSQIGLILCLWLHQQHAYQFVFVFCDWFNALHTTLFSTKSVGVSLQKGSKISCIPISPSSVLFVFKHCT